MGNRMLVTIVWALFAGMIISGSVLAVDETKTVTLESDVLSVEIDSEFPRIIQYVWKESGAVIYGQDVKLNQFCVNGENEVPREIKFSSKASSADYAVRLAGFSVNVRIEVVGAVVEFKVTRVGDGGYHNLRTIGIPGQSMFSLRSNQAGAAIAAAQVKPRNLYTGDVFFSVADAEVDMFPVSKTYIIGSTDELAVTMFNNVLTDRNRMVYQTVDKGAYKQCGVWSPEWIYREVEAEIVELPYAKIIITPERNGDGKVDWQDGAIAYRDIMISPLGSEDIKKNVVSQIAMNFASMGQQPFLRVLDSIKMTYLLTDGMGQSIQFKGYQSEGHDSAHPDYGNNFNRRAGGQDDLNFAVDKALEFNTQCGGHVNVTEFYPEAKHYSNDKLTGKRGWAWLDQSIYADKRYDLVTGNLYARLDELKAAVPNFSFLYVDVYWGEGWESWKLGKKMHELGWVCFTEFEGLWERDAVWIHRSQKPGGLGVHSRIIRFIRNHQQDVWLHNDLLRGSYNLGFLGWHTERDINKFTHNVFTNNLPTKYMQHFKIVKWSDERVDFEGNVHVAKEESKTNLYKDGKLIATGVYNDEKGRKCVEENKLFLPWDPIEEVKVYHWNEAGGASTWKLPNSWAGTESVKLYELTDIGRKFVKELQVAGGGVTVEAKANTPYVIYKAEPKAYPRIVWGEGSVVKDPGFESHGFDYWSKSSSYGNADHVSIRNDSKGQTHLRVSGNDGADALISQTMTGLEGGKTYAASVWVEIAGERPVTLGVKGYGGPEVVAPISKTNVVNYCDTAEKYLTNYQRIKVLFDVPAGKSEADIYLKVGRGAVDSMADFDNVRVVATKRTDQGDHYFFEDFENVDEGWGPFVYGYRYWMMTHLSELHEGYTDDTISGEFSLKTFGEKAALVYRTLPATVKFEPNTKYTVSFDYLQVNKDQYNLVVRTDEGKEAHEKLNVTLKEKKGRFSQVFTTGDFGDYYVGVFKNDDKRGVFVIDNFAVDLGDATK